MRTNEVRQQQSRGIVFSGVLLYIKNRRAFTLCGYGIVPRVFDQSDGSSFSYVCVVRQKQSGGLFLAPRAGGDATAVPGESRHFDTCEALEKSGGVI